MTTSNNKLQQVIISAKFLFLKISEESIIKHPKEDPLNQRNYEVLWKGPIEFRAYLPKEAPKKK